MQNAMRMKLLEELMREQPDDPFPPYALALEWASIPGQEQEAIRLLTSLKQQQPDYLPLYYQLGHLLARTGATDAARIVLEEGKVLAGNQNNRHTRAELESYLDNLDDA